MAHKPEHYTGWDKEGNPVYKGQPIGTGEPAAKKPAQASEPLPAKAPRSLKDIENALEAGRNVTTDEMKRYHESLKGK